MFLCMLFGLLHARYTALYRYLISIRYWSRKKKTQEGGIIQIEVCMTLNTYKNSRRSIKFVRFQQDTMSLSGVQPTISLTLL